MLKKWIAEFIGTGWLVLGGCGSAVLAAAFPQLGIGFVGVSLAFGLTVLTMAYAIGHVSGCHLNPAVTVGLWAGGRFKGSEVLGYIVAQVLGAIAGAAVLYVIASGHAGFDLAGGFASNGYGVHSPGQFELVACFVCEFVLTFAFLFVIMGATHGHAPRGFAPLAIGLCLTLIHLISIPVTNTSVNPARSTGPALFVGGWAMSQLWLFWVAPIAGAIAGGMIYRWLSADSPAPVEVSETRPLTALYDNIGKGYARRREPDPHFEQSIDAALGDCSSLLNVGAGTGSYEPRTRQVVALEPSAVMIAQRPQGSAPVVQGRAECLPFRNKSFDAVLAVLTVHHWTDRQTGFSECARVARKRVLFLSIDIAMLGRFWLFDYFPELREVDRGIFPALDDFRATFPSAKFITLPVPADCRDGFLGAYWRRPEAYLNEAVRSGISSFGRLSAAGLEAGLRRLAADLNSGAWQASHADLLTSENFDAGYRLIDSAP